MSQTDTPVAIPVEGTEQEAPYWAVITTSGAVQWHHGRPTYDDLNAAVGGYLEGVPTRDASGALDEGYTAYCNEEGKLKRLPHNPAATRFTRIAGDVLVGPVVIVGPPDDEGDDTPMPADIRLRLAAEVANA